MTDTNVSIPVTDLDPSLSVSELPTAKQIKENPSLVHLPTFPDYDTITPAQFILVARHMTVAYGGMTVGEAVADLRRRHVRGNQRSFNIVNGIVDDQRQANRPLDMTEKQSKLVFEEYLQALSGTGVHRFPDVQLKLDALPQAQRDRLINRALSVENQGQVSDFLRMVTALIGRPERSEDSVTDNADSTDVESGEEPF